MAWWANEPRQSLRSAALLQVDLGGHSAWAAQASQVYNICRARAQFAENLTTALSFEGFDRLFWAGDGGVFVAKPNEKGFPEKVCSAADITFSTFAVWKKKEWDLHLRVTATFLQVLIDPDPAHWCSTDFNSFLKYERDISLRNAFVITEVLQQKLIDASESERFTRSRHVPLPNGDRITVYVDSHHSGDATTTEESFGHWLRDAVEAKQLPKAKIGERSLIKIGNCTVLDVASETDGYGEIVLEPQQLDTTLAGIEQQDRADWEAQRRLLRSQGAKGTSVQVTHFVSQITDDQARLKYRQADYVDVRAFLRLMESKTGARDRYRPAALEVVSAGTNIPNLLSTAIVAIAGDFKEPLLILANRKGRTGGFDPNCWAVSIGEQVMPVTGLRGTRTMKADLNISGSAERGLREELITEKYSSKIKLSIHSFICEDLLNTFIFAAIADLRPLSFDDLAILWQKAPDRAEHHAIAALPATATNLRLCMAGDEMPPEIWSEISQKNLLAYQPGVTAIFGHSWQQNSHVRLALCYWYLRLSSTS
jgi:hypothetical protein